MVLSTAYENSLADTRRTATSYAAALMAALEVFPSVITRITSMNASSV